MSQTGLSITDSALLISIISYAFVLLAGYRLVLLLYGEREAVGALLLLALYAPLRDFSDSAFSDPPGLAILFAALWLLARYAVEPQKRARLAFLAGSAAGIAVATRYALAPLVFIGALFVFMRAANRIRDAVLFLIAPGIIGILVILRNLDILHGSVLPHYLPSRSGHVKNTIDALTTVVSEYADWIPRPVQAALLAAVVIIALWLAQRRGQLVSTLTTVWLRGAGPALLCAFGVVYSIFLIMQRSHSYIDPIGPRYMLPGSVVFVVLFAVFVVRATGVNLGHVVAAGCVIGLLLIAYEVRTTIVTPVYDAQRHVAASERLTWIQKNTTNDDLIVGQDSVEIPFYLGRTVAVSYSTFPFTEVLPYDKNATSVPALQTAVRARPPRDAPASHSERASGNRPDVPSRPLHRRGEFRPAQRLPGDLTAGGVEGWPGVPGDLLTHCSQAAVTTARIIYLEAHQARAPATPAA